MQTDRPNLLIKKQAGRRRAFVHIDHDERPEEIVPVVGRRKSGRTRSRAEGSFVFRCVCCFFAGLQVTFGFLSGVAHRLLHTLGAGPRILNVVLDGLRHFPVFVGGKLGGRRRHGDGRREETAGCGKSFPGCPSRRRLRARRPAGTRFHRRSFR